MFWESVFFEAKNPYSDSKIIKPGIVIRESRITYDHYGVYVGDGMVIHFTDGQVRETSLETFCRMPIKIIEVMQFDAAVTKKISLTDSAKRARKQLGKGKYDLINNNCEHFAIWCRTGKAYSSQALGSVSESYKSSNGSLIGDLTKIFAENFGMSTSRIIRVSECRDN